jgi:hypothetical protein
MLVPLCIPFVPTHTPQPHGSLHESSLAIPPSQKHLSHLASDWKKFHTRAQRLPLLRIKTFFLLLRPWPHDAMLGKQRPRGALNKLQTRTIDKCLMGLLNVSINDAESYVECPQSGNYTLGKIPARLWILMEGDLVSTCRLKWLEMV